MRAFPLCALLLSLSAWPAHAEWRKLGFAAQLSASTQQLGTQGPIPPAAFASASGFYTFDTDAPAVDRTPDRVEFAVQDHEVTVTTIAGADHAQRVLRPADSTARIVYDATNDTLTFVLNQTQGDEIELRLQIVAPDGPFDASMDTLPGDGYETQASVFGVLQTPGVAFQSIWLDSADAFVVGAVQYAVAPSDAPAPRPCSPADLSAPFGVLNFFDLQAYLQSLAQGCP